MELYNEEMKDEILVTRRATYKAEEAVSRLEKDKGRQDLFIDRLMDQASWFARWARWARGGRVDGEGAVEAAERASISVEFTFRRCLRVD